MESRPKSRTSSSRGQGDCLADPCAQVTCGPFQACDGDICAHDQCRDLTCPPDHTCLRGRCSLAFDCDRSHALCEQAPPECGAGMSPSVAQDCWGPCVPDDECTPSRWGPHGRDLYAGVWLIGWEGAALRFSVLRFPPEIDTGLDGDVELLADPGLSANLDCSGVGRFMATASSAGFLIEPPPPCEATMSPLSLMFKDFGDANGRWGSTLRATIESLSETNSLEAYWFPADTCDSPMTACTIAGP